MNKKKILVVGGAGFIGSHVNQMLCEEGYETVIFDNLSSGNRQTVLQGTFIEGDLANQKQLQDLFASYKIDAVMHFAAFIDVGESVRDPAKYYQNNVVNTLHLLNAMREAQVANFVFSSSAAVYGLPHYLPLDESHPCHPINPYGRTKWMVEQLLQEYQHAYGLLYVSLRYFNAAGGDPRGKIKNYSKKSSNLIPLLLHHLKNPSIPLIVYGNDYPTKDGSCIRDYIHIEDLGRAHLAALKHLFSGGESNCYNLGNECGFTVLEVIQAAEKVTGLKVNYIIGSRREGDPPTLFANAHKAHQELDWRPCFSHLEQIIADAWKALEIDLTP